MIADWRMLMRETTDMLGFFVILVEYVRYLLLVVKACLR